MKEILGELMEFKKGNLILARDFNFCMDHRLDSTSSELGNGDKQLRLVKKTTQMLAGRGLERLTPSYKRLHVPFLSA